jgi:hypothetical protein
MKEQSAVRGNGGLVFHATGDQEYRCHPYALFLNTRGWDCWRVDRSHERCLGRELTISQAMKLAEQDAKNAQTIAPAR